MMKQPSSDDLYVLGVDPGCTTGMTMLGPRGVQDSWAVERDPKQVAQVIVENAQRYSKYGRFVVACETIVGGGLRSRDLVYTIELVGWVRHFCQWQGYEAHMQPPQRRRSRLTEAKDMLEDTGAPFVIHQVDALAHALAWRAGA